MTQSPCLPEPHIIEADFGDGGWADCTRQQFYSAQLDGYATRTGYSADQINAYYLKGYEAGLAAAAQAVPEGFVLVPREPTFEMNKAGQEAVWDFHPDDTIEGNEETARAAYFAMLAAAPTQGAEGAAPQAVVGEASEVKRLLDVHAVSMTMGGRQILHSAIDRLAALTPSPAPSAAPHQGADALREALKDTERLDWLLKHISVSFGMKWDRFAIDAARAALAQHQPQQG